MNQFFFASSKYYFLTQFHFDSNFIVCMLLIMYFILVQFDYGIRLNNERKKKKTEQILEISMQKTQ